MHEMTQAFQEEMEEQSEGKNSDDKTTNNSDETWSDRVEKDCQNVFNPSIFIRTQQMTTDSN